MKPKIAVFGLPERSKGKFIVRLHSGGPGSSPGEVVFSAENDETGAVTGQPANDIGVGTQVTISILSSGIVYDYHTLTYLGGDISYVPLFRKETNVPHDQIAEDWDIPSWNSWNPHDTRKQGNEAENQALVTRQIIKIPIQDSYYYESGIDYTEKFHKLWIGLNAFATEWSSESGGGDRLQILSLVNSPLQSSFTAIVNSTRDDISADRYRQLQNVTGIDMSSNIVRDEIGRPCSVFDFLEKAKLLAAGYASDQKELSGLAFLRNSGAQNVFVNIFSKYHEYMASEEGMPLPFDLANAFDLPFAPASVERYGRLLFHNPFKDNSKGSLFEISDYFGSDYAADPYSGQTNRNGQPNQEKRQYEDVNPLFFRYLNLLYEFRCAYFHGSLPLSEQNNELAKSAYTSLREIYPAILR